MKFIVEMILNSSSVKAKKDKCCFSLFLLLQSKQVKALNDKINVALVYFFS